MRAAPKTLAVLRHRTEFLAVAKSGRKWVTPGLILQTGAAAGGNAAPIRYGLTASRTVGQAVVRNCARRRLRALAQEILPLHALPRDYVLIARTGTARRAFADLRQDLVTALRKLNVWKDQ